DLWSLERAGAMNAAYHVLGGTLSQLDGVGPDDLNILGLIDRVGEGGIRELIIAVNATVEIVELAADGHAMRQPRDLHVEPLQLVGDVMRRRLSLDGG
ncbi:toprim domain-containing protein, partial [Rhizobium johnstonii]|uniref:toprim domain-containing protein n=1 Tax=Rhizobium johnstonii TaxID=3019933 RepID=UPI003F9A9214